jgi:hypothetical protein
LPYLGSGGGHVPPKCAANLVSVEPEYSAWSTTNVPEHGLYRVLFCFPYPKRASGTDERRVVRSATERDE